MSCSIELTTKNFSEATKIIGKDEFCFIIGNEKVYCHKFVAAFLSNSVSKMLISDPTCSKFHIEINYGEKNDQKSQIQALIKDYLKILISGEKIDITEEELEEFDFELNKITPYTKYDDLSSKISTLIILTETLNNQEIKDQLYASIISSITKKINQVPKQVSKESIETQIKQIQKLDNLFLLIESKSDSNYTIHSNFKKYYEHECQDLIEEIASHMFELDDTIFNEMNEDMIDSILSSPKLRIESEDSLLKKLLNRRSLFSSKNAESKFFIEKVRFEYLSEEAIELFLSEYQFEDINSQIWSSIKKRLVLRVQIDSSNEQRYSETKAKIFQYNRQNPFNGIFQYLTTNSNGNIQTNKTIEITVSKLCCGKIETLVDFNDTKNGHTHLNSSSNVNWIQIDFKDKQIIIDSYLIKSCNKNNYVYTNKGSVDVILALRSWNVEASSDGNNWELIDKREDVRDLNGEDNLQVFNVSNHNKPFRFIRIISDKVNWFNDAGFTVSKLEFFGKIIE